MHSSSIQVLKEDYDALMAFFIETEQPSFQISINNAYRKNLVLSAASFFESEIKKTILNHTRTVSRGDEKLVTFIDSKVLARQYHSLFDWDAKNCNKFFKCFGEVVKDAARSQLIRDDLIQSEIAFLEMGAERNRLVHQNFSEIVINSTFDEIYRKYVSACPFIEFVKKLLAEE